MGTKVLGDANYKSLRIENELRQIARDGGLQGIENVDRDTARYPDNQGALMDCVLEPN